MRPTRGGREPTTCSATRRPRGSRSASRRPSWPTMVGRSRVTRARWPITAPDSGTFLASGGRRARRADRGRRSAEARCDASTCFEPAPCDAIGSAHRCGPATLGCERRRCSGLRSSRSDTACASEPSPMKVSRIACMPDAASRSAGVDDAEDLGARTGGETVGSRRAGRPPCADARLQPGGVDVLAGMTHQRSILRSTCRVMSTTSDLGATRRPDRDPHLVDRPVLQVGDRLARNANGLRASG